MSYMRSSFPLKYFKIGESVYYVFLSDSGIEDYNADYTDINDEDGLNGVLSFIELIGNIVLHETRDEKYASKIVYALAWKYRVTHLLREKYK